MHCTLTDCMRLWLLSHEGACCWKGQCNMHSIYTQHKANCTNECIAWINHCLGSILLSSRLARCHHHTQATEMLTVQQVHTAEACRDSPATIIQDYELNITRIIKWMIQVTFFYQLFFLCVCSGERGPIHFLVHRGEGWLLCFVLGCREWQHWENE